MYNSHTKIHYHAISKHSLLGGKEEEVKSIVRLVFKYLLWVGYFIFNFHVSPMNLLFLLPNNNEEIKVPIGKVTCSGNFSSRAGISSISLSDTEAYVLVFLEHWTASHKGEEI